MQSAIVGDKAIVGNSWQRSATIGDDRPTVGDGRRTQHYPEPKKSALLGFHNSSWGRCLCDFPEGVCGSYTHGHTFCTQARGTIGLLLAVLLGPSAVVTSPSGTRCPPAPGRSETCVCKLDKGIIDLTPLSNTDGTPRYFCSQLADDAILNN